MKKLLLQRCMITLPMPMPNLADISRAKMMPDVHEIDPRVEINLDNVI
jgi:hypothetical protein